MYKTSLLATGKFKKKCGILGVGTKQFTLSLEEFKDALYLLNYMGGYHTTFQDMLDLSRSLHLKEFPMIPLFLLKS